MNLIISLLHMFRCECMAATGGDIATELPSIPSINSEPNSKLKYQDSGFRTMLFKNYNYKSFEEEKCTNIETLRDASDIEMENGTMYCDVGDNKRMLDPSVCSPDTSMNRHSSNSSSNCQLCFGTR